MKMNIKIDMTILKLRIDFDLSMFFCFFNQAPPGIKKNLQRTYDSWSPEFISRGKSSIRAQALFVLAWFHAIVQERRNYIPQVSRVVGPIYDVFLFIRFNS